jgi:hypothetical protein
MKELKLVRTLSMFNAKAFRRLMPYVQTEIRIPALAAHLLPKTVLVSSSLSSRPKFLIVPAVGALSRGCAASAFRYAVCIARTRVACKGGQLDEITDLLCFAISDKLHTSFL